MIYRNIDFHNVEELEDTGNGYRMWRIPKALVTQMGKEITACYGTGVELRFHIKGEKAVIRLRAERAEEAQVAYIYFGSFQGGWQYSAKIIGTEETCLEIPRPDNLRKLQEITKQSHLPYDPEVVRIVLPYCSCYFLGAEGEIEAPLPEQLPRKTYLAYGSSITHGSLALAMPYSYPFRIAQRLGCDYLNQGYAGSAHLEREMAEYLVARKDWNFASVEMGINMLGDNFEEALFEERVDVFTDILSRDSRPVFATSIFTFNGERQEKAAKYRKIVQKYAGERLLFTDGRELLDRPEFISQDLTHPTLDGMEEIAKRWENIMRNKLPMEEKVGEHDGTVEVAF